MSPASFSSTGDTAAYLIPQSRTAAAPWTRRGAPATTGPAPLAPMGPTQIPAAPYLSEALEPLSPSSVITFCHDCQCKWFYRKVLELPEPLSGAVALGHAVHAAIAENFRDKLETGEDLPTAGVKAIFSDMLHNQT